MKRIIKNPLADMQVFRKFADDVSAVVGPFFVLQDVAVDEAACFPVGFDFLPLDKALALEQGFSDRIAQADVSGWGVRHGGIIPQKPRVSLYETLSGVLEIYALAPLIL